MTAGTVRLTTAQAIVRYLIAQRVLIDGSEQPLFPGVFAIFGHGNVTCLGNALEEVRAELPTYRGQNEQGMALAGVGYAKAMRRQQIMVAASSIGPGSTNMVTAAGVAHANRLPILLLAGDTFQSRIPDPVLQQVEHYGNPSTTANDAFRAVTRYWDRIVKPEQVVQSLPLALATMLDPADCGPALIALPQDVQAEVYDYPVQLFERRVHELRRQRPDRGELARAAAALREASRPLIVAGGGVHYSLAEGELARFAEAHGIPVVETVAGKSCLTAGHPLYAGPIGVIGSAETNRLVAEADCVLAVGTRLQDFTTGSWTVFANPEARVIGLNAARFDAGKHLALPLVADAGEGLRELGEALGGFRAPAAWRERAAGERANLDALIERVGAPPPAGELPSYAQVICAVHESGADDDYVVTAAGGFPGELNIAWRSKQVATFDCDYGFSCMGYEIAGSWGARLARSAGEVLCFVGDGSYLMLNSDLLSSVITGQKLIVIVCDNGGYAVIERLQVGQGGASFNNMFDELPGERVRVDFAAHARSLGCLGEQVADIAGLQAELVRARAADRTTVIAIETAPAEWIPGGTFWEVGIPELSHRPAIEAARQAMDEGRKRQRVGW